MILALMMIVIDDFGFDDVTDIVSMTSCCDCQSVVCKNRFHLRFEDEIRNCSNSGIRTKTKREFGIGVSEMNVSVCDAQQTELHDSSYRTNADYTSVHGYQCFRLQLQTTIMRGSSWGIERDRMSALLDLAHTQRFDQALQTDKL